jgi:hypothetical protein
MTGPTGGAFVVSVGVMRPTVDGGVWHGPGRFVGQGQQRIPLGTGQVGTVLLAGKQHNEDAGQQQAEENG